MNPDRFTSDKTGKIVKIDTLWGKDWAFIPDPLPPAWELAADSLPFLCDAIRALAKLDGTGRRLSAPTLLLAPLQQREALRSSSLEGTYATPRDLLFYELEPREPRSENDAANAWLEVANHNKALHHGFVALNGLHGEDEIPLCLRLMREMHKVLLTGVRGQDKKLGEFRKHQVHVGSDRRYIPPPPDVLDESLANLERYINTPGPPHLALVQAYVAHYQFEAIHPFHDGNGRVGRALLSLTTYLWHDHQMPWLYMSAFFDRYKDEYIGGLFRVSTHGDWRRWIDFCLRGTIYQCEDAIRRCELLDSLKIQFHRDCDPLSHRAHIIIDKLFSFPAFSISHVQAWCGVSWPTAKGDILKLIDAGVVEHWEGKRPQRFVAPAILNAAYSDDGDEE